MIVKNQNEFIQEHCWSTLRSQIQILHPQLFESIEAISPNSEFKLFKIKYPYGTLITNNGVFQVPVNRFTTIPLLESNICPGTKHELSYAETIPLGLVSNNSIESFFIANKRIIPASLKQKGSMVALWKVLDENKSSFHLNWSITSGARSICMLPNIKDMSGLTNLKKYFKIKSNFSDSLFDQWNLFKEIAQHPDFSYKWDSEIIFFGKKWFDQRENPGWSNFYTLLFREFWKGSTFRRDQFIFDTTFSLIQEKKNLRPNPYLADTARHLIAIGCGAAPGFSPALNEDGAPIKGLQEVFLSVYDLKKYIPVIMHLKNFCCNSNGRVYYSFQMPTTNIFSPKSRKMSTLMVDLHEVRYIMNTFLDEIKNNDSIYRKTPLYPLGKNITYKYYHSSKDEFDQIISASSIPSDDENFKNICVSNTPLEFPEFCSFFRGCIAITNQND